MRGLTAAGSVLVPVPTVRRVAVPVMEIVDMSLMGHSLVAASVAVRVGVVVVLGMGKRALVPVVGMRSVSVPLIDVVDVAPVRD